MAEKKIRLLPVQTNNLTINNNLLDFHIPEGLKIDGSKSYISLFARLSSTETNADNAPAVTGGDGVHNVDVVIKKDPTDTDVNLRLPPVSLVKNSQLVTANKGLVENIRDVNKLRISQLQLGQDFQNYRSSAHKDLGAITQRVWGYASPLIDFGNRDDGVGAQYLDKEIRIPLGHTANLLQRKNIDTGMLGKTHLHLEMDMERVGTATANNTENGVFDNDLGVVDNSNIAGDTSSITLTHTYSHDIEGEMPYYINQKIVVSAGAIDGVNVVGRERRIVGINVPGNKVILNLDTGLGNVTGASTGVVGLKIRPTLPATAPVVFNKVEMVLCVVENAEPMNPQYSTYTTERDNGNGVALLQRQYEIEPEAYNMLVHLSNDAGGLLSNTKPEKTRVVINNQPTTNRDVGLQTPLYYSSLNRYAMNGNIKIKDVSEGIQKRQVNSAAQPFQDNPRTTAYIYEPLPFTSNQKLVELEIHATNTVKELTIFKEVGRSL